MKEQENAFFVDQIYQNYHAEIFTQVVKNILDCAVACGIFYSYFNFEVQFMWGYFIILLLIASVIVLQLYFLS